MFIKIQNVIIAKNIIKTVYTTIDSYKYQGKVIEKGWALTVTTTDGTERFAYDSRAELDTAFNEVLEALMG